MEGEGRLWLVGGVGAREKGMSAMFSCFEYELMKKHFSFRDGFGVELIHFLWNLTTVYFIVEVQY